MFIAAWNLLDSLVALAERGMTFLTGSQMLAASQSQ